MVDKSWCKAAKIFCTRKYYLNLCSAQLTDSSIARAFDRYAGIWAQIPLQSTFRRPCSVWFFSLSLYSKCLWYFVLAYWNIWQPQDEAERRCWKSLDSGKEESISALWTRRYCYPLGTFLSSLRGRELNMNRCLPIRGFGYNSSSRCHLCWTTKQNQQCSFSLFVWKMMI